MDESLKRLQTDHIDLLQHHEVIRPEDPDRIFGEGGAQEAMLEARKAGKIRYIGFTGHSLWLLLGACQSICGAGPRAELRLKNLVCNSNQL